MPDTTFAFKEVKATIQHPLVGQKVVNGEGIGTLTVSYADDLTQSDQGADGAVMVSKIESRRGTVALDIQQTSSLNKWLINYANAVQNASASQWAGGTFTMSENFTNGISVVASSLALQKRPDHVDAQNGGRVSWVFFSPNIVES